jgi:hypothetical protein
MRRIDAQPKSSTRPALADGTSSSCSSDRANSGGRNFQEETSSMKSGIFAFLGTSGERLKTTGQAVVAQDQPKTKKRNRDNPMRA